MLPQYTNLLLVVRGTRSLYVHVLTTDLFPCILKIFFSVWCWYTVFTVCSALYLRVRRVTFTVPNIYTHYMHIIYLSFFQVYIVTTISKNMPSSHISCSCSIYFCELWKVFIVRGNHHIYKPSVKKNTLIWWHTE